MASMTVQQFEHLKASTPHQIETERDGAYLYEIIVVDGEEVAFASWRDGTVTYTLKCDDRTKA